MSFEYSQQKKWYMFEGIDMLITPGGLLQVVYMYWNITVNLKNMYNYYGPIKTLKRKKEKEKKKLLHKIIQDIFLL